MLLGICTYCGLSAGRCSSWPHIPGSTCSPLPSLVHGIEARPETGCFWPKQARGTSVYALLGLQNLAFKRKEQSDILIIPICFVKQKLLHQIFQVGYPWGQQFLLLVCEFRSQALPLIVDLFHLQDAPSTRNLNRGEMDADISVFVGQFSEISKNSGLREHLPTVFRLETTNSIFSGRHCT